MKYIVGFSRKLHLVARAIMWFTRSNISHVYIRQDDSNGLADYVLEATHRGVNIQWYGVFKRNKAIIVREFEVDWDEEKLNAAWAQVCYERLNLRYGWLTLVGHAYVYIVFWLTKKWVKNPFPAPWKDHCAELTLSWILKAGIPGFAHINPDTPAPSDGYSGNSGLLQAILDQPEIFKELQVDVGLDP